MRADRLVAVLLLLQSRRQATAAEVAGELEVSERTARRDLEALSAAGVPVYSQPGRGGGWKLIGGARTDLSGLSAAEARTLFIVAGPAAPATPELKSALRKLVRALPEPFRAEAESAASSIVVDPDRWGGTSRARHPLHLESLQEATIRSRQVRLGYTARDGTASTRMVRPLGLVTKAMVWYLIAGTDAGQRTFRVDRVTSVEASDEPAERPVDFDLQRAWEEIAATIDELRSPVRVEAIAEPEVVDVLRWIFQRQVAVGEPRRDGRLPVSISGQSTDGIAYQLAGFGGSIEVIAPEEARQCLARIGGELSTAYGPSATPPGCDGPGDGRVATG
jgi:predicted DNA-binding transcriptional regulator YafY